MPRWKVLLLSLAVVLPGTAYVAGSLVGAPESPAGPDRIVLEQSGEEDADDGDRARPRDQPQDRPGRTQAPRSTPSSQAPPPPPPEGDQDDVVVVTPEPTTVRDDGDDQHDRDDRDDAGGTDPDGADDDSADDDSADDDSEDDDD